MKNNLNRLLCIVSAMVSIVLIIAVFDNDGERSAIVDILCYISIAIHMFIYYTVKHWGTNQTPLNRYSNHRFLKKVRNKIHYEYAFPSLLVSDYDINKKAVFRKADRLSPSDIAITCISDYLNKYDDSFAQWKFEKLVSSENEPLHNLWLALFNEREQGHIKESTYEQGLQSLIKFIKEHNLSGFDYLTNS